MPRSGVRSASIRIPDINSEDWVAELTSSIGGEVEIEGRTVTAAEVIDSLWRWGPGRLLESSPTLAKLVGAEVDDRVSDQLAGPMEGDVPSPIDIVHLGAERCQQPGRCRDVARRGIAPERVDRRVLEREQVVVMT